MHSSPNFADAVKHYRDVFAPRMLRDSTLSVWEGRLKTHSQADWNDVSIEHITIDSVNEWAWKKRSAGLSWVTIKDALRTMQRRPVFILERQKASLLPKRSSDPRT